jgi:hypothetical protein
MDALNTPMKRQHYLGWVRPPLKASVLHLHLNGRRAISNSGFSFFGNVRGSVLIGDIRNSALLPFMPAVRSGR